MDINNLKCDAVPHKHYMLIMASIVITTEMFIMTLFDVTHLKMILPDPYLSILDSLSLLLLSWYPVYKFVYTPILSGFRREEVHTKMLAEALRGAGDSIVITDKNSNILYVNKSFTDITGYTCQEVIGENPKILSSGKQSKEFYSQMWNSINSNGYWTGELWNRRKNGELYPERLDIRRIGDGDSVDFYVGVFTDIAEKKAIESALLQSQKIESLGTLVGGVAHNFNNLLAAISGKAFLGKRKADDEVGKYFGDIQKLSNESAEIIEQLLTFARETEHKKKVAVLVDVLDDAIETVKIGLPEDIVLNLNINDPEHKKAYIDTSSIKQSFINIINNARDAVRKESIKRIDVTLYVKDNKFYITISDTGSGISEENINNIFDPFFTTKINGHGTGLGLSTTISTIKEHHGTISVDSEYHQGTTFNMELPVYKGSVTHKTKEDVTYTIKPKTIMVVDDNPNVRSVVVEMLSSEGHRIIEANDGMDAIDKYSKNIDVVDIIVTDVVMPKRNGLNFILDVRKINKKVKVIFISGYDETNHVAVKMLLNSNTKLMYKPFSPDDLYSTIYDMLKC